MIKSIALQVVSLILFAAPYAMMLFIVWWLRDFRSHVIDIRGQIRRNADLMGDTARGLSAILGLPAPDDLRRFAPPAPSDNQEGQVYFPKRDTE